MPFPASSRIKSVGATLAALLLFAAAQAEPQAPPADSREAFRDLNTPGLYTFMPLPEPTAAPAGPPLLTLNVHQDDFIDAVEGRPAARLQLDPEPSTSLLERIQQQQPDPRQNTLLQLPNAQVRSRVGEAQPMRSVFSGDTAADWRNNYEVGVKSKLHDRVSVTMDSHLGVAGRDAWSDDPGATAQQVERRQNIGTQFQITPKLQVSTNVQNESRLNAEQATDDMMERTSQGAQARLEAWQGGVFSAAFRNEMDVSATTEEVLGSRDSVDARWEQQIPKVPLTTSVSGRLDQSYDPASPERDPIGTSQAIEGAVQWKPTDPLTLRLGLRRTDWSDEFGEVLSSQDTWFAEHKQALARQVDWLTRASFEDKTNRDAASASPEAQAATLSIGPSLQVSDDLRARFELMQKWDQEYGAASWTPSEQRVSISIKKEF